MIDPLRFASTSADIESFHLKFRDASRDDGVRRMSFATVGAAIALLRLAEKKGQPERVSDILRKLIESCLSGVFDHPFAMSVCDSARSRSLDKLYDLFALALQAKAAKQELAQPMAYYHLGYGLILADWLLDQSFETAREKGNTLVSALIERSKRLEKKDRKQLKAIAREWDKWNGDANHDLKTLLKELLVPLLW